MQIFRVNFYEPLRFFYFWSDDFIKGIARFLFCTLTFSLLVKYTLLWWIIFSVVLMIYEIYMNYGNEMKMNKWSSQWTQFMQLRKEAWKKFRTSTGFEPVTSRFTDAMLYQLSYEATDVGSRSIVGSYVPVKEISVNDIWNKSYMNCGNEMKMTQLHKLRSLRRSFLHFRNFFSYRTAIQEGCDYF